MLWSPGTKTRSELKGNPLEQVALFSTCSFLLLHSLWALVLCEEVWIQEFDGCSLQGNNQTEDEVAQKTELKLAEAHYVG